MAEMGQRPVPLVCAFDESIWQKAIYFGDPLCVCVRVRVCWWVGGYRFQFNSKSETFLLRSRRPSCFGAWNYCHHWIHPTISVSPEVNIFCCRKQRGPRKIIIALDCGPCFQDGAKWQHVMMKFRRLTCCESVSFGARRERNVNLQHALARRGAGDAERFRPDGCEGRSRIVGSRDGHGVSARKKMWALGVGAVCSGRHKCLKSGG